MFKPNVVRDSNSVIVNETWFIWKRVFSVYVINITNYTINKKNSLIFGCVLGRLKIRLRFEKINKSTPLKQVSSKLSGMQKGYRVFLRAHVQIACNCRRKFFRCEYLSLGVYWRYSFGALGGWIAGPPFRPVLCLGHRLNFIEHSDFILLLFLYVCIQDM
jgi:hypothetical protein